MIRALVLVLAALVADARADGDLTASEVAGAPRPGEESGRVDDVDEDRTSHVLARGILVLPRAAFEIAFGPVRAGVWAYDRFALRERWFRWFFNDARTIGLYPTVRFDAGFGVTVGARLVARDVLGNGEHLALRAAVGGTYREIVTAAIRSGQWLEPLELEVAAEHEQRPRDRYYGIGNADAAMATRYRQQLRRASMTADLRVVRDLHVRGAGALAAFEYGPGEDGPAIDTVYMPVVGYSGVRMAYGELELVWDSRGSYSRYEPAPIASIGWFGSVYGGHAAVADGPDFFRVGADAQHFLRITKGPRVIATRVHVEAVSGGLADVPFDELPKLGGTSLLRGYPTDRFRDRVAALGTLEYRWDLSSYLVASTFVDAGRVARSFEVMRPHDLRVGYGIGLDAFTERSFVMRASLATSIDGGVFFHVAFDPAFDLDPRVERR